MIYFEPGVNAEKYWDYNHMVLQQEDVMDCCRALLPNFRHVFLFDSSSGHSKKRVDGLDASSMNKEFGVSQPRMRDTRILDERGCLGTKPRILEEGDTQTMKFALADRGPFNLTPEEREARRFDTEYGDAKVTSKTKKDLITDLTARGVHLPSKFPNKMRVAVLRDLARRNGIELTKTSRKIRPGWVGKPKGLLQVMWERGFIDEEKLDKYKLTATDHDGELIEEYSLRHLMSNCTDFATEKSQLQSIAEEYDMEVIMTPKYHCEIAGCGIEYCWGGSKAHYRSIHSFGQEENQRWLLGSCQRQY